MKSFLSVSLSRKEVKIVSQKINSFCIPCIGMIHYILFHSRSIHSIFLHIRFFCSYSSRVVFSPKEHFFHGVLCSCSSYSRTLVYKFDHFWSRCNIIFGSQCWRNYRRNIWWWTLNLNEFRRMVVVLQWYWGFIDTERN